MIVSKEYRHIGWGEVDPAFKKSYDAGIERASQIVHKFSSYGMRDGLKRTMKETPLESRNAAWFFFLRGLHDGLAKKPNNNEVEIIIAAFFHCDDDEKKRINDIEVEAFLSSIYPEGKPSK